MTEFFLKIVSVILFATLEISSLNHDTLSFCIYENSPHSFYHFTLPRRSDYEVNLFLASTIVDLRFYEKSQLQFHYISNGVVKLDDNEILINAFAVNNNKLVRLEGIDIGKPIDDDFTGNLSWRVNDLMLHYFYNRKMDFNVNSVTYTHAVSHIQEMYQYWLSEHSKTNSSSSSKMVQISMKQAYNNLNNLYYEITFDNNPRRISIEDLLLHIYNDDQVSKLVDSIPWSFYRTEVDESSYPGTSDAFQRLLKDRSRKETTEKISAVSGYSNHFHKQVPSLSPILYKYFEWTYNTFYHSSPEMSSKDTNKAMADEQAVVDGNSETSIIFSHVKLYRFAFSWSLGQYTVGKSKGIDATNENNDKGQINAVLIGKRIELDLSVCMTSRLKRKIFLKNNTWLDIGDYVYTVLNRVLHTKKSDFNEFNKEFNPNPNPRKSNSEPFDENENLYLSNTRISGFILLQIPNSNRNLNRDLETKRQLQTIRELLGFLNCKCAIIVDATFGIKLQWCSTHDFLNVILIIKKSVVPSSEIIGIQVSTIGKESKVLPVTTAYCVNCLFPSPKSLMLLNSITYASYMIVFLLFLVSLYLLLGKVLQLLVLTDGRFSQFIDLYRIRIVLHVPTLSLSGLGNMYNWITGQ